MSYIAVPCGGGQRPLGGLACSPAHAFACLLPACCLCPSCASVVSCDVGQGSLVPTGWWPYVRACACVCVYIYILPCIIHFLEAVFGRIFGSDFWPKFYRHSTAPPEKPLFIGIFLIPHGLKSGFSAIFRPALLRPSAALRWCAFAVACAGLLADVLCSRLRSSAALLLAIARKYNIFLER